MRPGFYIPECRAGPRLAPAQPRRFNEAGILHPGMRDVERIKEHQRKASMRPGFYIPECHLPAPVETAPVELQ